MNYNENKPRRTRLVKRLPLRVKAIEELAEISGVGYNMAFEAYNKALEYCKVFNDKSVLEVTINKLKKIS